MKGLASLIRLHKLHLDEARKALAESQAALDEIDTKIARLETEVAAEQKLAGKAAGTYSYGAYAQAVIAKRAELANARKAADQIRVEKEERVAEAFKELKKFEVLAERQAHRQRAQEKARDQAALDELGLQRFARTDE